MRNFVHKGEQLTVTAPYAVSSGGGVKVGDIFGIAVNDQVLNDNMEVAVFGVFDLAKDASTFNAGDDVYWDDTAKKATSVQSGHMVIGVAELLKADGTAAPGGLTGDATVRVRLNGFLPGTVGVSTGLRVAHALYDFTVDAGGQGAITPANSDTIPANAIVHGGVWNSTVAPLGSGATVAIGTVAGSAANSILTATAITGMTLDAVGKLTCATTPFKMSAAGKINVTIATHDLTAGQIEVFVLYNIATNA